ncbi:hypothetical protein WKI68_12270 [Streptomyces sp. MS1.HAVA.3]|uniref:Lipoprotein n=1 Tax=Streptomyces caledonius TaxID=3134107 RepID=A0ABU8U4B5_9ACTN
MLLSAATASAAASAGGIAYFGLGDNAQAGTAAQADAAADVLTPAAAPARDAEPVPMADAPANDTTRGMVYDGLKAAPEGDKCVGVYRTEAGLCSHGPDAPPKGVDIKADVAPVVKTKAVAPDPARPASGGYALIVSNRPYYGAWLLDLQRADGRATQVWTVQKVGWPSTV